MSLAARRLYQSLARDGVKRQKNGLSISLAVHSNLRPLVYGRSSEAKNSSISIKRHYTTAPSTELKTGWGEHQALQTKLIQTPSEPNLLHSAFQEVESEALKNRGEKNLLEVAKILQTVGMAEGQFEKAEMYLRRALSYCEMAPDGHLSAIETLGNLFTLQLSRGDFESCGSIIERMKTIGAQLKRTQYSVSIQLHILQCDSRLRLGEEDFSGWALSLQKLLALQKKIFGEIHADVARTYFSLGNAYRTQRRYVTASNHLERAMSLLQALDVKGENPDLLYIPTLISLGKVKIDQKQYHKAKEYLDLGITLLKSISRSRKDLPEGYLKVGKMNTLNYLAEANCRIGEHTVSITQKNEEIKIATKLYGEDHPEVKLAHEELRAIKEEKARVEMKEEKDRLKYRKVAEDRLEEMLFGNKKEDSSFDPVLW